MRRVTTSRFDAPLVCAMRSSCSAAGAGSRTNSACESLIALRFRVGGDRRGQRQQSQSVAGDDRKLPVLDRSVYVVEHADGAGNCVVTIFVDDLDARVAAIAGRGLEPDEREAYPNGVRKVIYRDPDGNELGLGGPPLDAGSSG